MRRVYHAGLVLALATVIHVDWHLARPAHHRLSLAWPQHWLFAIAAFAVVGWLIARASPASPGRTAAGIVALAVLVAQAIEPMLEMVVYRGVLGYPRDPGRWTAFVVCLGAGLPAMVTTLALCRRAVRPNASPL